MTAAVAVCVDWRTVRTRTFAITWQIVRKLRSYLPVHTSSSTATISPSAPVVSNSSEGRCVVCGKVAANAHVGRCGHVHCFLCLPVTVSSTNTIAKEEKVVYEFQPLSDDEEEEEEEEQREEGKCGLCLLSLGTVTPWTAP